MGPQTRWSDHLHQKARPVSGYQDDTAKSIDDDDIKFEPSTPTPTFAKHEWIVEGIFPSREIHLIHGPSYIGKTRIVLREIVYPIERGLPVWGHASTQCKCAYVACDNRSLRSVNLTLNQLGMTPYRVISTRNERIKRPSLERVRMLAPECELYILDPITRFMPGNGKEMNDYQLVADFMFDLGQFCDNSGVTIIGMSHDRKGNDSTKGQDARESLIGSSAMVGHVETVISMGRFEAGDAERRITRVRIDSRSLASIHAAYQIGEGGIPTSNLNNDTKFGLLDKCFTAVPVGTVFTSEKVKEWAELVGVSQPVYYDWIKDVLSNAMIADMGKQGRFKVYQKLKDRDEELVL